MKQNIKHFIKKSKKATDIYFVRKSKQYGFRIFLWLSSSNLGFCLNHVPQGYFKVNIIFLLELHISITEKERAKIDNRT